MHVDPLWVKLLLKVHVSAGLVSFVLAPAVLVTAKGGTRHKRWGMVYFWSMGLVALTALPLALFRPVLFLALISVLSFYLTFSGYRVLRLKHLALGGSAKLIDWLTAVLTFTACACLAGVGLFRPLWVQNMGLIAAILGALGMRTSAADIYHFMHKPTDKMFWWYAHLTKFIGSYIAAWTAFSVATLSHIFRQAGIVLWLWPATIGIPAVLLTVAYYRRKFAARQRANPISGQIAPTPDAAAAFD